MSDTPRPDQQTSGENGNRPWYADSPEFVPEWDVARNDNGEPITITGAQGHAILRALRVVASVQRSEGSTGCNGIYEKSRLLGRMLYEGLPPTRTKPPHNMGAPWWGDMPGGDPFLTEDEKEQRRVAFEEATRKFIEAFNRSAQQHSSGASDG